MTTALTGKHQMQRRRLYLEDRMTEIDEEIERYNDESTRLKLIIAGKPTEETLAKSQRRLNFIRQRSTLLRAEKNESAEERARLIKQLRNATGNVGS